MAADCVNLASGGLSGLWRLIFGFWLYLSGSRELGYWGLVWLSLTCAHGLLVCSTPKPGCALAAC